MWRGRGGLPVGECGEGGVGFQLVSVEREGRPPVDEWGVGGVGLQWMSGEGEEWASSG